MIREPAFEFLETVLERIESVGAEGALDGGKQLPFFEADVIVERAGDCGYVARAKVVRLFRGEDLVDRGPESQVFQERAVQQRIVFAVDQREGRKEHFLLAAEVIVDLRVPGIEKGLDGGDQLFQPLRRKAKPPREEEGALMLVGERMELRSAEHLVGTANDP